MIRLLLALLIAGLRTCAFGQLAAAVSFADSKPDAGGSPTYLIKQGFEGTGYDNGESWTTVAGTVNPDATANAFEGSQSLYNATTQGQAGSPLFTPQSTIYGYFTIYVDTFPTSSNREIMRVRDDMGNFLANIESSAASGSIRVQHGTADGFNTHTLTLDARAHIWYQYIASSGANDGEMNVWVSSDDTKPGTPTITMSAGTATASAAQVVHGAQAGTGNFELYTDKVRVDDEVIGSNPE